MNFLIGFNMVTTVIWYFYIAGLMSKAKEEGRVEDYDFIDIVLVTAVFEGLTLLLTGGIYMILK